MKPNEEVMEIWKHSSTGSYRSAGRLAGCDPKTVARYVSLRDLGRELDETTPAEHRRALSLKDRGMGRALQGRSPRRQGSRQAHCDGLSGVEAHHVVAVALAKEAYERGHRRVFRPWAPGFPN